MIFLYKNLKGDCGIFLTNRKPKEIQKYYEYT